MKIAIIGCGFVADYYLEALKRYPELEIAGIYDKKSSRSEKLGKIYKVHIYRSLNELLNDRDVGVVVNLTNPDSHYEISKSSLLAGKSVYTEKPLAMKLDQAIELVKISKESGIQISAAPCSLLGEAAQTIWRAVNNNLAGKIYVVYAEMDDGMIHKMPYWKWESRSGAKWPYLNEFEVGCIVEHAGYYLTWLTAFFGPAKSLSGYTGVMIENNLRNEKLKRTSPDFSVACIQFESGIVARLTCSIVSPRDHSLTVVGSRGILYLRDCWNYRSKVKLKKYLTIRRKMIVDPIGRKIIPVKINAPYRKANKKISMDYARGIIDLSNALEKGKHALLGGDFALHNTELVLAMQNLFPENMPYKMTTTFKFGDTIEREWHKNDNNENYEGILLTD